MPQFEQLPALRVAVRSSRKCLRERTLGNTDRRWRGFEPRAPHGTAWVGSECIPTARRLLLWSARPPLKPGSCRISSPVDSVPNDHRSRFREFHSKAVLKLVSPRLDIRFRMPSPFPDRIRALFVRNCSSCRFTVQSSFGKPGTGKRGIPK